MFSLIFCVITVKVGFRNMLSAVFWTSLMLASNVKTDPKSFYAYVRSKSKTKTSVGSLKNEDDVLISDDLQMSEILNSYFGSVFTKIKSKW